MNSKKVETFFFSTLGVIAAFAILVAINFIFSSVRGARVDLTDDKIYTLSEGTRAILKKLDTPVTIRYYFTQSDDVKVPPIIKNHARRVEDLLHEYQTLAPKFIKLEKLDPQPDTDAEDSANLDGIDGQMLQTGERLFHGVSFTCLDQKESIPFLAWDRERLLEYDVSRAISRVMVSKKPVIGVISALPIFGTPATPQMMRMGQFQGAPAWMVINELKADFEVKEIQMTETEIPDDVDVLLVVHPKNISEGLEYGIDQFVLGGGKLIAMVDPLSVMDQSGQQNPMMGGGQQQTSSSLDKLFAAWGVKFDKNKVIADRTLRTRVGGPQGQPQENPTVLSLTGDNVNTNDISTAQIGNLLLAFAGAFTNAAPAEGLKQVSLVESTPDNQLVDGFMARMAAQSIMNDFKPNGGKRSLAIKLSGKFKTAFPDGKPGEGPAEEEKKDDEKKENSGHLAEGTEENHVILVSDADMIHEQFCVRVQQVFGARFATPFSANLTLLQNFVEQMAGDSNLINARSRAIKARPFTVIAKMRAEAEEGYRTKIKELESDLQETQRRLNELQRSKEDANQKFILSPEQKKELEDFRQKQVDTNKKLKNLRKDLRKDIDFLERWLGFLNIFGMPIIVIVIGLITWLVKRAQTAAR